MPGRVAITIDKDQFQAALTELEAKQTFANRSLLWTALAETPYAKSTQPRPLSPQVAMLKADELGLTIVTPKGRKGLPVGTKVPNNTVRRSKVAADDVKDALVGAAGKKLEKLALRAAGGSMKAAIKLKCIDCCCGDKKEITNCTIKECSLWNFRPYRSK